MSTQSSLVNPLPKEILIIIPQDSLDTTQKWMMEQNTIVTEIRVQMASDVSQVLSLFKEKSQS